MKSNKLINGNSYYNPQLNFYIEKPDSWSFMPKEWAVNMKEIALENSPELKEKLAKAARPFLSFIYSMIIHSMYIHQLTVVVDYLLMIRSLIQRIFYMQVLTL